MEPGSSWSPYNQQTFPAPMNSNSSLSSASREDSLNNYGGANPNPLLISSCQGLQPSRPNADTSSHPSGLSSSTYESLLSPSLQPPKDETDFFGDTLFNGVCKENQSGIRNFLQTPSSLPRNESAGFSNAENSTSGYGGSGSTNFNSSKRPSPAPGPFGILPHESVMNRPNQFERNDKFISSVSKTVTASFNNGPYTEHDINNSIYSNAPLSSQSSGFSGDNASLSSPAVNSVTSPTSFSSPSEYYSSPKTNFGAYNNGQSPVPQSPSVAQHSYPSSPYTNVDSVNHIPSAPPCSPMNGGTYVNNLNSVPQRNGQNSQHSPNNGATNNVICYNQSQNIIHHNQQSVLTKTSDYHSDYALYRRDHNISPSSYSNLYPSMNASKLNGGNNVRINTRTHSQHDSLPSHDGRIPYMQHSSVANQNYVQKEAPYVALPSSMPSGQSLHTHRYHSCSSSMNSLRNTSMQTNPSLMPNHMNNDRPFNYQQPDMVDDKNALDIFNSHVDSGVHNADNSNAITNFLETDLSILEPNMLPPRQLRSNSEALRQSCAINSDVSNRQAIPRSALSNEPYNRTNMLSTSMAFPFKPNYDMSGHSNVSENSMPKKRGRRGRRRKSEMRGTNKQPFKNDPNLYNGYPMPPSKMLELEQREFYNPYPKRIPTHEFPPMNFPLSNFHPEMKSNVMEEFDKILPPRHYKSIEDELKFLTELNFSDDEVYTCPTTCMKTRNKDSEGFLNSYKNFLMNRKAEPDSSDPESPPPKLETKKQYKEHKQKSQPKLILKINRDNNDREWRLKETHLSPERYSNSDDSNSRDINEATISSQKFKYEDVERNKVSKFAGNFNKVSETLTKHSAKRKNDSHDDNKYNDFRENAHHLSNYEPLPAGKMKIKKEIFDGSWQSAYPSNEEQPSIVKKRGRKAKNPSANQKDTKKKICQASEKLYEPSFPLNIKKEIMSEDEDVKYECTRRSTLRARKDDSSSKEPQAGPSIKIEPLDMSSDEIDVIDDSDSDPAWTPSAKTPKASESLKSHFSENHPKKRKRRSRKNNSRANSAAAKKKKCAEPIQRKTSSEKPPQTTSRKREKLHESDFKIKKKRHHEQFLIAKDDINKEKPYIWRIDPDTDMLQRFDCYEEQGIQLYRNTCTYAAWNELSIHNYVKINVKTLSHSRISFIVEYLGPDESDPNPELDETSQLFLNLRENFEVFLQTLISQALDGNFLSEITKENDEYFLNNVKEIEKVTEDRKNILVKDTWDQALKKCADTYPCVNILDNASDGLKCQVCNVEEAVKLVQFYGQPYDCTTLGSLESPLAIKTQFHVCSICAATVSLYSRLQHQKYNFFIKCRTKMNQVKSDNKSLDSHALLEVCLDDHSWVNMLFAELRAIWRECDKKS